MIIDVKKQFEENPFLRAIKQRYENGEQNVFLTVGDTNSGKTVFNIMLYWLIKKGVLNQDVSLKKNCKMYFSVSDFAKDISKIDNEIIFYDEAGTELDIGEWNNLFNKTLRHILQTQRVKRNFYFILVPHKRFITNVTMPLFNYFNVINKIPQFDNTGKNTGQSREAHIYKIKTTHFKMSGFEDYFYYKKLAIFYINDILKIENKDFKDLYNQFHKVELEKKQTLAEDIEDETKLYLMKQETKKLKIEQAYNKLKEKEK